MEALMTAQDVADLLRISRRKFEQMVAASEAPQHHRIGRLRRWAPEDVERWLEERLRDGVAASGPAKGEEEA